MSGHLPQWVQRLLGFEAKPGQGLAWGLQHQWPWPPWLTLLAICGLTAYVVWIYLREGRQPLAQRLVLAGLRLAALGLVLLMIAQVSLRLQRTGLPTLALLLDDSQSMSIVDRYAEPLAESLQRRVGQAGHAQASRWNLARTLLTERESAVLNALARRYTLRPYFLCGDPATGADAPALATELGAREPTGETTRLGAGLRNVLSDLRGNPPAAILVLSDGINTDGPGLADGARLARNRGVPLFLVGLGDDRPQRDLRLSDLLVEELVFVDDVVSFEFKLTGVGCQGRKMDIRLSREDQTQPLASVEVTVGPDGQAQTVRIPYRPAHEGRFRFRLEVAPLEGELETANNRLEREIEVRKEKIRVLLADGAPRYEFRYLRNLLARDATIELHSLLQEADLEHTEQDPTALRLFPLRRDELLAYDVILVGDLNPALLGSGALRNLAEYVLHKGHGGAVVFIPGPRFMPLAYRGTPLAGLMPVDLATARYPDPDRRAQGFRVVPTEVGRSSPGMQLGDSPEQTARIWEQLPALSWVLEARDLKPGARVLAEASYNHATGTRATPVMSMQFVGAGRVLMHLTDETWRWRYRVGDVYFARYWIQTIRYLARSKLSQPGGVELDVGHREYRRGESVPLSVRFNDESRAPAEDDGVAVVLEHQGGKTQRLKLQRAAARRGWFETTLSGLAPGDYHAWLAVPATEGRSPAVDFSVIAPPGEFERTRLASAEMQQAAELTKGRYYTPATIERLLEDLPEGRPVPIESLPPRPLWNRWPLVLLLFLLLAAEWIVRKRTGMV